MGPGLWLTLPQDYAREARDLAGARREAFLNPPVRRNQVWQMDLFELETAGGGTWRSGHVVDYWGKVVLAGPVTKTQTYRDATASVQAAIDEAERPCSAGRSWRTSPIPTARSTRSTS